MTVRYLPSRDEAKALDTAGLRRAFLIEDLFRDGELRLQYCDLDRVVVGAACPRGAPLGLEATEDLKSDYFCERRELGVINIGGPGWVEADGERHEMERFDCLYLGRGARSVVFSGEEGGAPDFYLVSYPAHKAYPTAKYKRGDAKRIALGGGDTANEREIFQYIHEGGIRSCQLVMGFTALAKGSVWNTMPPHTHDRRSEVYLYFDLPSEHAVIHFMGQPQETRHLVARDRDVALSPAWSIHAGCGTSNYAFVWAMGGENQRFDDMDAAAVATLR